jgi:hypothetical protein
LWQEKLKILLKIRKSEDPYKTSTDVQKRDAAKALIADLVASTPFREADTAESRNATKIIYEKPKSKYTPVGSEWGLRHLTEYLLHHCAQVNQITRRLLSRAEIEIYSEAPPPESA